VGTIFPCSPASFNTVAGGLKMAHESVTNLTWSAPADPDTVYRRAGGRRAYNRMRATRAEYRRTQVVKLLDIKGGMSVRGTQAEFARRLGVSRAMICRDLARIRRKLLLLTAPDPMSAVREPLFELWSRDVLEPLRNAVEAEVPAAEDAPAGLDDRPGERLRQSPPGTLGRLRRPSPNQ
jgi:hypothetical protein